MKKKLDTTSEMNQAIEVSEATQMFSEDQKKEDVKKLDALDLDKLRESREAAMRMDNEIAQVGRARLEITIQEKALEASYLELKNSEENLFKKLKEKYQTDFKSIDLSTGEYI